MLLWNNTRVYGSIERNVHSSEVNLIAEGMALVSVQEGGLGKVKRSAGAATEIFAGICSTPRLSLGFALGVEKIVAATATPTILGKLSSGFAGAFRADTGAAVAVTAGAASTTNIQSTTDGTTGKTKLTFDASFDGIAFNVYYKYAVSASEAINLYGQAYAGQSPTDQLARCSTIFHGEVWTNNIDPAGNWFAGRGDVKAVATGIFTDGGNSATGIVVAKSEVIGVPTADVPYLGLLLS